MTHCEKHYITPDIRHGRLRLIFRWIRFACKSLPKCYFDFIWNSCKAIIILVKCSIFDLLLQQKVQCNVCGWQGNSFYPNTGSGYFETNTTCPKCFCQDRHRTLVKILESKTDFFSPDSYVIEVAPMRTFQRLCLERKQGNYTSFDYERFAMEQGDITRMRFEDNSCDFFLCFHVLEHIPDEIQAIKEIKRVLKPGGVAIVQVPIFWDISETYDYDKPDPRETYHVRRYGYDFASRMESFVFHVTEINIKDIVSEKDIANHGYSTEPVYLLKND